jgi:predicted nuclease of predicted toxin-antitoxin system
MDPDIAAGLRRYGIDATTTQQVGLRTRDDEDHLAFIRAEGRVIVTDDADFLRIASKTNDHPGIVFCMRSKHTLGEIIQFLILVYEVYEPADMVGRVEFL